jgi:hypothetical protein
MGRAPAPPARGTPRQPATARYRIAGGSVLRDISPSQPQRGARAGDRRDMAAVALTVRDRRSDGRGAQYRCSAGDRRSPSPPGYITPDTRVILARGILCVGVCGGPKNAHPVARAQRSPSQSSTVGSSHRCVSGSGGSSDGITYSAAPPGLAGRLSGGSAAQRARARAWPADRSPAGWPDQRRMGSAVRVAPTRAGWPRPATPLAVPVRRAGLWPQQLVHPATRPCGGRGWSPAQRRADRSQPFWQAPARCHSSRPGRRG